MNLNEKLIREFKFKKKISSLFLTSMLTSINEKQEIQIKKKEPEIFEKSLLVNQVESKKHIENFANLLNTYE